MVTAVTIREDTIVMQVNMQYYTILSELIEKNIQISV